MQFQDRREGSSRKSCLCAISARLNPLKSWMGQNANSPFSNIRAVTLKLYRHPRPSAKLAALHTSPTRVRSLEAFGRRPGASRTVTMGRHPKPLYGAYQCQLKNRHPKRDLSCAGTSLGLVAVARSEAMAAGPRRGRGAATLLIRARIEGSSA